jgi:exodeoxyribonuclease V beta subunit
VFRDINLGKHGLIEASAGTGKTYTIERLVLRLLAEKKVQLENILVVTFTEAAAMELRSRIRGLLEQACANNGIDGYDISAEKIEILRGELLAFDRAKIFTIHGFCNWVLSRWPQDTGLAKAGEIVDEPSLADTLVAEEMRSVWEQWDKRLNGALAREISRIGLERFRAAVCAVAQKYGPGHVELAPEAAGDTAAAARLQEFAKTTRLAADICGRAAAFLELYKKCPSPHRFSYKKFQAGREAAALAWCEKAASAQGVLPQEGLKGSQSALGWTAPDKKLKQITDAAQCWDELAALKQEYDDLSSASAARLETALAASLRARIDRHRIVNGLISYNDMIRSVERALSRGSGALAGRLRGQYRYAIIDEFQDTNALQWNIFRSVFIDGGEGKLFVVGDPKQSIFRVQDADVYTYLEARGCYEKLCGKDAARLYSLDVNYRSERRLVGACNGFFSRNGWFAVPGIDFRAAGANEGGGPAGATVPDVKAIAETLKPSGPVVVRPLYDREEVAVGTRGPRVGSMRLSYARYIVSKIVEWHTLGLPYRSMALLYETRTYVAPLLPLLREAGIPYSQYKEAGLFTSSEALNWVCLLEYLGDGTPQNFGRLLLSDFFGLDPGEVIAGAGRARFETIAESWRGLAGRGQWPALLRAVFSDTALLCRAARRTDGKRVIAAYRQIGEWAGARLVAGHMPPLEAAKLLRAYYSGMRPPPEEEDRFRRETEEDAVAATTIHSSKGLQFDVVFVLAGAGRPRPPEPPYVVRAENGVRREKILVSLDQRHRSVMAQEDESERRRLLYVALTRARYKMVLPSWEEAKKDKKTGALLCEKLPPYEKNLLDAGAADEALFCRDSSVVKTAAPGRGRRAAYQRPRAAAFTGADSGPVACTEARLGAYAAACGIAGRRRLLHSYSSLVHGERGGSEWQDEAHDGAGEIAANLPRQLRLDPDAVLFSGSPVGDLQPLPLFGKKTGTALHEVLEGLDFTSVGGASGGLMKKIENRFASYGLLGGGADKRAETCRQVTRLLRAALSLKIGLVNGESLSPDEIAPKDILSESYFSAAVGRASGRIAGTAEGAGTADSIIGFIDVIFRKGKDIYLLDWKSDTLEAYDKKTICEAMEKSGYTVQAALYAAAYHKWLSERFGSQGYAIKGICYVFLRGPAAVTIPVGEKVLGAWKEGLAVCFKQAVEEKIK